MDGGGGGGRTDEFCRFILSLVDEVFEALFHAVDKLLVGAETLANHSVHALLEICFKNKMKIIFQIIQKSITVDRKH